MYRRLGRSRKKVGMGIDERGRECGTTTVGACPLYTALRLHMSEQSHRKRQFALSVSPGLELCGRAMGSDVRYRVACNRTPRLAGRREGRDPRHCVGSIESSCVLMACSAAKHPGLRGSCRKLRHKPTIDALGGWLAAQMSRLRRDGEQRL